MDLWIHVTVLQGSWTLRFGVTILENKPKEQKSVHSSANSCGSYRIWYYVAGTPGSLGDSSKLGKKYRGVSGR